jgi:predicted CoA-binding protein
MDGTRLDAIGELLVSAAVVAVVGLSPREDRDSNRIARYLRRAGYRIIPVNPSVDYVLGEQSYPELSAIPAGIEPDIVNVFRRPVHVPEIVERVIERETEPALWLQLGCSHPQAEDRARKAGLFVVSEHCIMVEHRRRFGNSDG